MDEEGFIPDLPRFVNEEQELRWILTELHKDHQRKIEPIILRLSKIDAAKPLPPVDSPYDANMEQLRKLLQQYKKDR
jgi:hypothetical protein